MQELISIALACYNGEKFLAEQLNSIFNQTYKNLEVIASVDLSTDSTIEILENYSKLYNLKIVHNHAEKGVLSNFQNALIHTSGKYIAFADQDDVWFPDKIEKSLELIVNIEKSVANPIPILVFSDLKVVDQQLNVLHDSYLISKGLNPDNILLQQLMIENVATGCTILINNHLKDLVKNFPKGIAMHDVFMAMTASAFGRIGYLPTPTLYYRQHGSNVVGLSEKSFNSSLSTTLRHFIKNEDFLEREILQASAFYKNYQTKLRKDQKELMEAFLKIKSKNFIKRLCFFIAHKFIKGTGLKTLNFWLKASTT
ncbi:MAG: glycosyltransferase family 2 protein [Opitutaceae bacterium]|nr:glycosyltransferase family 2 protein [Cytophagales bacterium]